MGYETIDFRVSNGIGTLSLNRPKNLNALNAQLFEELIDLLHDVKQDKAIRVVVLRGEGRAFCAGGDVKEMVDGSKRTAPELLAHLKLVNKATADLINLPIPVIGMIKGIATGAGVSLTLATDIAYAAENTNFSEIFGQVGLCPDMASSYLLPRVVGRAKAKELVFTYKTIDAQEAYRIGLIQKVLPEDQLEKEVYELAAKLAQGPTHAYAFGKKMINQSFETDLDTALDYEAAYQVLSHLTADHQEGIIAFQEKRKPVFQGK